MHTDPSTRRSQTRQHTMDISKELPGPRRLRERIAEVLPDTATPVRAMLYRCAQTSAPLQDRGTI